MSGFTFLCTMLMINKQTELEIRRKSKTKRS